MTPADVERSRRRNLTSKYALLKRSLVEPRGGQATAPVARACARPGKEVWSFQRWVDAMGGKGVGCVRSKLDHFACPNPVSRPTCLAAAQMVLPYQEERIAALEAQLADLQAKLDGGGR